MRQEWTTREQSLRMLKKALIFEEDERIVSSDCREVFLLNPPEETLPNFPPENGNSHNPTIR
jgi:hypothetical protein